MSQEPIEVVREQFAATNERDFERAMDYYARDVVLVVEEGFLNTGTFEGREAVGEWFGDWFRAFGSDYRFEILESRDLGGGVVFLSHHLRRQRAGERRRGPRRTRLPLPRRGRPDHACPALSDAMSALEAASLPEWSGAETD